jgi:ABC-type sugar transport system ATPase subunit
MREVARDCLASIGASLDVDRPVGELPISKQQRVQIAGAVARGARILILDEPTSSLSQVESERLFGLIGELKAKGVTFLYISHRLEEIFRLCDHVTVLRDGRLVLTQSAKALGEDDLVRHMIGRSVEAYFPTHLESDLGGEVLRVEGLSSPKKFSDISFNLRAGEILGLAGLVGAGRTEVAEAVFGLDPMAAGRVWVQGKAMTLNRPEQALSRGVGLIPEDRKRHGLVLSMKARENITLPTLERLSRFGWVHAREEEGLAKKYFELLKVRASGTSAPTAGLSGGNQQKLVIAKWLASKCKVLIIDEPTRGVDVGAKAEIHGLIDALAREGNGVLLISSELPEILNLSTRILVLREGRIVKELHRDEADQEKLLRTMAGI